MISIIVPVYNSEKFLAKCIESLINQTYRNIEIILVNDGSQDSSLYICHQYAQNDKRIKVIDKSNGGVSSARNMGIDVAAGELIAFVDSDDFIDKDMYKLMKEKLIENKVDSVVCGYYEQYSLTKIYKKPRISDGIYLTEQLINNIIDDGTLTGFLLGSVWMMLYKTNIIRLNKISFDEGIHDNEDGLFNLKYILNSKNILSIQSNPLYYYRDNPKAITYIEENSNNKYSGINKVLSEISDQYPKYHFEKQLRRRMVTIALWQVLSICNSSNIGFIRKLDMIKQICNRNEVVENVDYIDFSKLHKFKKLYVKAIIKKQAFMLLLATKYLMPILKKIFSR